METLWGFLHARLLAQVIWVWLKMKHEGQTAGVGPCFHLPGFLFGTGFWSHSQIFSWGSRLLWPSHNEHTRRQLLQWHADGDPRCLNANFGV